MTKCALVCGAGMRHRDAAVVSEMSKQFLGAFLSRCFLRRDGEGAHASLCSRPFGGNPFIDRRLARNSADLVSRQAHGPDTMLGTARRSPQLHRYAAPSLFSGLKTGASHLRTSWAPFAGAAFLRDFYPIDSPPP